MNEENIKESAKNPSSGGNMEQMLVQETNQEEVPNTMQGDTPEKSTSGPIVGVVIIIILLIVGGVYFWGTTVNKNDEADQLPAIQSGGEADAIVKQLESQGTSDEIADIEADLNTTDLESLDSELDDLLNEL